MKQNISESEKFMQTYNYILQEVKKKWIRSDCKMIGISESKASRVFNGQFDILTLLEMASICNFEHEFFIKERKGVGFVNMC